mgnify:CR=1 FL=1
MYKLIAVFIGGGAGSIARFMLSHLTSRFAGTSFPFGTLAVNVASCLVLGAFITLFQHKHPAGSTMALLVTAGFCGGFSTFSAFSQDTLSLLEKGQYYSSALNAGLNVILCLAALYASHILTRHFMQ